MLQTLKFFSNCFAPTYDALFNFSLPWDIRWRLLILQPVSLLTFSLKYVPYLLSSRYSVINIPSRGHHSVRAIVFQPKHKANTTLHPLHVDFHGGAFLGGIAEFDAPFCELLSDRAGAVVISAQYRCAPAYAYPCAHEDAEDVIDWAVKNARRLWNADAKSLTVSGESAGGNLMFTAGRRARAAVGFCTVVDFRLPPWEKPKPENFPTTDPLSCLMPLYDVYAGPARDHTKKDARLNPTLKNIEDLPEHILLIIPEIDILVHEQLAFIDRIQQDVEAKGMAASRKFETIVFDKGFHGWLQLPLRRFDEDRKKAFNAAIEFIKLAHQNEDAAC